jgi:hypothetical protein
LIVTVMMMAGWGCRPTAKLTPPPTPSARFLLKDEQIIGLRMTRPPAMSLHQFAKESVAIAQRIMVNPQLFAIKMKLKTNGLEPLFRKVLAVTTEVKD